MRALVILGFAATAACASLPLDRSLPIGHHEDNVPVEDVPIFGAICAIDLVNGSATTGELLAVERDHLYLYRFGAVVEIPRSDVASLELRDLYTSGAPFYGLWMAGGLGSAVSHGWLAIVSVPLWLIAGIPVIIGAALSNDLRLGPADLDQAYQFARYPQGMPRFTKAAPPPTPPTRTSTLTRTSTSEPGGPR